MKKQFHPCLKTWRTRIDKAEKRGGSFSDDDLDDANRWNCCAVGEAQQKYPLIVKLRPPDDFYEPMDSTLRLLGGAFATAIGLGHYVKARDLIDRIEQRLIQLHKEATDGKRN